MLKTINNISEREMFEKSFQRPNNYFELTAIEQYEIDKKLGILDWMGTGLSDDDIKKYNNHYKNK